MEQQDRIYLLTRIGIFAALVLVLIIAIVSFTDDEEEPITVPDTETAENLQGDTEIPPASVDGVVPSFDVVRISRGGTGVVAGRAQPGSLVELFADDALIGSVRADTNGEWVMILEEPLESGPAELSLTSRLDGDDSIPSNDLVVVSVPERLENQDPQNGVVAILTPRDGQGQSRVMQRPGNSPVGEIGDSLTVDTIDYSDDGRAIIAGRAVPRARVAVYLDNGFLGAVRANDAGRWSVGSDQAIAEGEHTLRIDQVVNEGDVQLRIQQPFTAGMPVDQTLREGKVVVQPGNSLWHIARRIYGAGVRYTVIFQENQDQIMDPDLIYPGQLFDLPVNQGNTNNQQ